MVTRVTGRSNGVARLAAAGRAHGPQAAVGSGLTKQQGEDFTVSWAVSNGGNATGFAVLSLEVAGGAILGILPPVGVLPGPGVTLTLGRGATLAPGTYTINIVLTETNADASVSLREIGRDFAVVTIAAPAAANLLAVGSPSIS